MNCPHCNTPMNAIQEVYNHDDKEMYRLRKCPYCWKEFYTVEFETELTDEFRTQLKKYSPTKRRLAKIRPIEKI